MVEGEKMSKSLGNFVTIRQVLADWPGDVVRLTMLKTHYRQPIDWTLKGLKESEKTLRKWRDAIRRNAFQAQPLPDGFLDFMCDDLNTHGALGEMHRFGFEGNRSHRGEPPADAGTADAAQEVGAGRLIACADFLGIELRPEAAAASPAAAGVDDAVVAPLVEARLAARRARDFAEADRLRAELAGMGIALKDGKDPATGEPVTTWEVAR
jgi:cysteinyl-tRNA synthetase